MLRLNNDKGQAFPQYTTRTLEECFSIRSEKQVPTEEYPLMAFTADGGVCEKGERYDRSALVKNANKQYKRTELNDFIYSSNNLDVGSIGLNEYGKAVISDVYEIFSVNTSIVLPKYISECMQVPRNLNKMLRYRQGALYGQYRIHPENFLKIKIEIPCIEEQQRIIDCLSSVDAVIADYEAQVENMQNQKKGVMQKLFSQEARFKADDGSEYPEWEILTLEQVADFLDGKRKPLTASARTPGPYPYYGASGIVDYVDGYLFDEDLILLGEDGANIVNRSTRLCFIARGKYWVNNHAHVIKPKEGHNLIYICEYLESLDYSTLNTGSAQPKLNQEVCKKIEMNMPCLEEQQKVADCLTAFDDAIEDLQKTVEHWKNIKKGLLQQLFA